jgi:hypothetical protein
MTKILVIGGSGFRRRSQGRVRQHCQALWPVIAAKSYAVSRRILPDEHISRRCPQAWTCAIRNFILMYRQLISFRERWIPFIARDKFG